MNVSIDMKQIWIKKAMNMDKELELDKDIDKDLQG